MKWLTTGQLIDKLQVGQVAQNQKGYKVAYGKKADLYYLDEKGYEDGLFPVCAPWVKQDKWFIVPEFVTFEEAMLALKEGKTITYHDRHPERFTFDLKKDWDLEELSCYTMNDLFKPQWTIES